ncbi:MAG TPA: prolyl oligopeptidase family serine peptidase [Rhizomicrobium sp.]|nr:prolyl oligopeptidase family serine peptidase [Rhizomicrobium sp.]
MRTAFVAGLLLAAVGFAVAAPAADDDPNYWLSDIHGAKAVAWAKEQTAHSSAVLKADPRYAQDYADLLKSLDVPDRIPQGRIEHGMVYDFWQDAQHHRGLWRRTTVSDYANPEPHWQTLLDVDKLDAAEHANFVFGGAVCAPKSTLCLIHLSPGGGDAVTVREFDLKTRTFVKGGFTLPVAKLGAEYRDANIIYFWTDFGAGTRTTSSYPRIVKVWHRGTPIASAQTVFEAAPGDISARTRVFQGPYGTIALIEHQLTFFTADYLLLGKEGSQSKIAIPDTARLDGAIQGKLIFTLRDDWNGIAHGTLIALDPKNGKIATLYTPDAHSMVDGESIVAGRDAVYASIYTDVTGAVHAFRPSAKGWTDTTLALPQGGSTTVVTADPWSGAAQFTYESFLTPPTLYATDGIASPRAIKSQAPLFDASALTAEQFWVTSSDGTRVPYFLIHRKDRSGAVPTILYSYGGFELSLTPWYWDDGHRPLDAAQVWIAKGGALAVANIRGGGEFGPAWHNAALREHRQLAFDDFAAVARDLEARGVTTPAQLGIVGASNGGVLTTVTLTQHPELLGAVVSQRPLVDMLRYTRFGAGASWIGEYGDPDKPQDRAFIEKYSAYENVKPEVKYPPILFITETTDDRVTPVWARMMAAKMEAQGHDVLFNESAEGGHGPGSTNAAQAEMWALSYVFFKQTLGFKP